MCIAIADQLPLPDREVCTALGDRCIQPLRLGPQPPAQSPDLKVRLLLLMQKTQAGMRWWHLPICTSSTVSSIIRSATSSNGSRFPRRVPVNMTGSCGMIERLRQSTRVDQCNAIGHRRSTRAETRCLPAADSPQSESGQVDSIEARCPAVQLDQPKERGGQRRLAGT